MYCSYVDKTLLCNFITNDQQIFKNMGINKAIIDYVYMICCFVFAVAMQYLCRQGIHPCSMLYFFPWKFG